MVEKRPPQQLRTSGCSCKTSCPAGVRTLGDRTGPRTLRARPSRPPPRGFVRPRTRGVEAASRSTSCCCRRLPVGRASPGTGSSRCFPTSSVRVVLGLRTATFAAARRGGQGSGDATPLMGRSLSPRGGSPISTEDPLW